MSARLTKVVATDIDSGESETATIQPDSYVVICGPDRYVSGTQVHANGTHVVTIKPWENDHR